MEDRVHLVSCDDAMPGDDRGGGGDKDEEDE